MNLRLVLLVAMLGAALLSTGCQEELVSLADRAVTRYCDRSPPQRRLLRDVVAEAVAPNTIEITCVVDAVTPTPEMSDE
jgi:hypothetical protein